MALDPRIPLQAQYQPIDTLGVLMHRRQMQRQEALDAEARNDRDEARKDRDLDRRERAEDRTLRREQLNRQVKRDATEDEMRDLDIALKKSEVMGRVLGTVKDQASYDRARATLGRFGIQTDQFDPIFKPDVVAGYVEETNALRGKLTEAKTHWVVRTNPDGSQTAVAVEDKPGVTADLGKKPGEAASGFTLSPGQVRYGPDGKPIASGPPRPASESTSPTREERAEKWRADQYEELYKRRNGKPADPFTGAPAGPPMSKADYDAEVTRIENGYLRQLGQYGNRPTSSSSGSPNAGRAEAQKQRAAKGGPAVPRVGQTVTLRDGRRVTVTKINGDGTFDYR